VQLCDALGAMQPSLIGMERVSARHLTASLWQLATLSGDANRVPYLRPNPKAKRTTQALQIEGING
jgi:hypothetical protein